MNSADFNFELLKVRAVPIRKDNKDWVEGFLYPSHDFYGNWHIMELFPDGSAKSPRAIRPETVCRCTGKYGKHNLPIYENDILFDGEGFLVVRWENKKSAFILDDYGVPEYLTELSIEETSSRFGRCDTLDFDDLYTTNHFIIIGNTIDNPEFKKDGLLSKKAFNSVRVAKLTETLTVTETGNETHTAICEFAGKTYSINPIPDIDVCWQMAEHIVAELDKEIDAERDER